MNKTFENLQNGEYIIKLDIKAEKDTVVSVSANHRQFLVADKSLSAGEAYTAEFALSLKDADFLKQDNYRDRQITLTLSGEAVFSAALEKANVPTVFTLGDSTVCNQEFYGEGPLYRCGGWGQALGMYMGTGYAVSNHAEQGTHTQDCLKLHFKKVCEQLKEGDIVICQFGHNDQKQAFLDAMGGYYQNLIKIGTAVKEKGAKFVVCSPIQRLIYENDKLNTYLVPWRDAAEKAAKELNCQFIDLHDFTSEKYLAMGTDAENLFFHAPALDRTHPNDFGAKMIAEYVSSCLINKGGIEN